MKNTQVRFSATFSQGSCLRVHKRLKIEQIYPWHLLDPNKYPEELAQRCRLGWTENAFNEYCTFIVMGELVKLLGLVQAPLDFLTALGRFLEQEAIHTELCVRMAERFGGLYPIDYNPNTIVPPTDPSLSLLEQTTALVVIVCCVGETFSLPMLKAARINTTHPLTKAVLTTIVKDEATHGLLGWQYLDWALPQISQNFRGYLGEIAKKTLQNYSFLWQNLTSQTQNDVTSEGFLVRHIKEAGFVESRHYKANAIRAIEQQIKIPFQKRGITVDFS